MTIDAERLAIAYHNAKCGCDNGPTDSHRELSAIVASLYNEGADEVSCEACGGPLAEPGEPLPEECEWCGGAVSGMHYHRDTPDGEEVVRPVEYKNPWMCRCGHPEGDHRIDHTACHRCDSCQRYQVDD